MSTVGENEVATSSRTSEHPRERARDVAAVTLDSTSYRVTEVRLRSSVGGLFGVSAAGFFVVVGLRVDNVGERTSTLAWDAVSFVAADATTYDVSGEVWSLDSGTLVEQDLPAGGTARGHLLFDVPEAQVAGGTLRVTDLVTGRQASLPLA